MRQRRGLAGRVWALPVTLVGLSIAALALASRGRVARRDGALEVWGEMPRFLLERVPLRGGADALTLGHVVVGRSADCLRRLAAHERVHVRQYERWGALLPAAYAWSSLHAWMLGRDPYRDNRFEREAFATARAIPIAAARTRPSRTPAARSCRAGRGLR